MARRKRSFSENDFFDRDDYGQVDTFETVRPLNQKEEATPETRAGMIRNAALVRVRDDPSGKGNVIKILESGDVVTIVGDVINKFYKIQVDKDTVGYVSSDFCMEVN